MFKNLRERYYTTKLIKEAVDTYPDGICFAYPGGRSILTNPKINEVCYALTGQTITNADMMWDNIKNSDGSGAPSGVSEPYPEKPVIRILPDGTVWQFQRTVIHVEETEVIQYTASDITEIYRYQEQLRENNERLSGLHERQRTLLQNIVQNNLNEELLSAKIRIHDSFGQMLILTQNAIAGNCAAEDASGLFAAWNNVITDMENASVTNVNKGDSPDKELIRIAKMIGCEVEIRGEQPQERAALLLMYAAGKPDRRRGQGGERTEQPQAKDRNKRRDDGNAHNTGKRGYNGGDGTRTTAMRQRRNGELYDKCIDRRGLESLERTF